MATIKSNTDLEQSKKLAEILPTDSADMRYGYIAPYEFSDRMYDGGYDDVPYPKDFLKRNPNFSEDEYDGEFPCWSLAALMDVLDRGALFKTPKGWACQSYIEYEAITSDYYNNPIDACVAMIEKLHEQNLL